MLNKFSETIFWAFRLPMNPITMDRTSRLIPLSQFNSVRHGRRDPSYSPQNYHDEVQQLLGILATDQNLPIKNNLIGPSVSGPWTPEMVFATGYLQDFGSSLSVISVQQ